MKAKTNAKADKVVPKDKKKKNRRNIKLSLTLFSRFLSNKFEELFSNNRFTVIVTFVLTVFLVFSVHSLGGIALTKQMTDRVRGKEVTINYDKEKFVIEGVPSNVEVVLYGDEAAIQGTKQTNSYSVLADLTRYGEGNHVLKFTVENLPANVKASVIPSDVQVSVYTKEFKEFSIAPEIINVSAISGVSFENPVLADNRISLKGSKKDLTRVAYVRALIDGKSVAASLPSTDVNSFEGRAPVVAYDEKGNKIENLSLDNVGIDYSVTLEKAVGVPINNLKPKIVGNFPEGQAIKNITLSSEIVTVHGRKEETDKLSSSGVEVIFDLKTMTADGSVIGTVDIPSTVSLTSVVPQKIDAKIEFDRAEIKTVTFNNIVPVNEKAEFNYTFLNDGQPITVDVLGTAEQLAIFDRYTAVEPLQLYANVADLGEGLQQVQLEVAGNTLYRYNISQATIRVQITKK